jgi:hypothetical protein
VLRMVEANLVLERLRRIEDAAAGAADH